MMSWKICGRKWPWPNIRYYLGIRLERLRKITRNLRISPRRNLNPGPTEYEAGMLTI
jgi:hypothetical protein